ncbi:MAG: precorrin-4 C(11)-methyltransferase [Clostridiales bacterium]|jgi:precorrin-4/cobalt-precorrin-4 C11-methyltransferase|nr:precorrin-4 C(11)-methyltransferase [Clostridiales bacterium]
MIHFVGAGPGAVDLITVRGQRLIRESDVIIYAGSLVNPDLLLEAKPTCSIYNSASMTLEEVIAVMVQAEQENKQTVRLHTGDPSLYGAIREQMDCLNQRHIAYEVVPGVSSFCGAAAALQAEYTLPDVSQTVIITRMAGRTPVPQREEISLLAQHQSTMVIFLSAGMLPQLTERLLAGGYLPDTPAAIVYKATWEDEKILRCTVQNLAQTAKQHHITKTALILVGRFLDGDYSRSLLYHPTFTHEFREGKALPQ